MRKIIVALALSLLTLCLNAQKDPFCGFYKGEASSAKDGARLSYPLDGMPDVYAEVYRLGDEYRLRIKSAPFSRSEIHAEACGLKAENGEIVFENAGDKKLSGKITPEAIDVTFNSRGDKPAKASFKRWDFKSPTLGAVPPAGAIVLFDGKDTSKWVLADGTACPWEVKDGAMTVNTSLKAENGKRKSSTIFSKDSFNAVRLHLEFKIPAMYDKEAQARANSGVFFGPYEIQVLDSFGSNGEWGDCGSVYRMYPPQFVASLEPEAWQTYDIEFHPAKFHNGVLTEYPTITVRLNGVIVQNASKIFYGTHLSPRKAAGFEHSQLPWKLSLQDHTNPVSFRNIWVETL